MTITLATLAKATAQQVFDQVAEHLLTQNEKSESAQDGTCVYRDGNGLKCAAGCLIADSEYRAQMDEISDGSTWGRLIDDKLVPTEAHADLIEDLQHTHDLHKCENWKLQLREVARMHDLSSEVVDRLEKRI